MMDFGHVRHFGLCYTNRIGLQVMHVVSCSP